MVRGRVLLYRVDPSRNMHRFYAVGLDTDMFGDVVVVREWGRIGNVGRRRLDLYADLGAGVAAWRDLLKAKERRGYRSHRLYGCMPGTSSGGSIT